MHLFNINDPHKTDNVPEKFLDFDNIHKIIIKELEVSYLLAGQDILASYKDSYIIIDSTPIAPSSEANPLSQMTDGVIVVIMADKTRRDVVKRELRAISSEKILGVVLNCAEFESSDYYHEYYRHYGKKRV